MRAVVVSLLSCFLAGCPSEPGAHGSVANESAGLCRNDPSSARPIDKVDLLFVIGEDDATRPPYFARSASRDLTDLQRSRPPGAG